MRETNDVYLSLMPRTSQAADALRSQRESRTDPGKFGDPTLC